MVKPSNENIDVSTWPLSEAQQLVDEARAAHPGLVFPGVDISSMSDQEFNSHVASVFAEMGERGTRQTASIVTYMDHQVFFQG